LSDWIGNKWPVTSSAPPWPRDWRIWWDPRAPHGKGAPAAPPTIDAMPPQMSQNPPQFTGTGCPGGQIQLELEPDNYDTWFMTDGNGNWTWTPVRPLPPGDYCVRVRQRCPEPPPPAGDGNSSGWSEWTDPVCFSLITIEQTIDFEAKELRYDSVDGGVTKVGNWPVRGVLRYNINGTWVMGVLRHTKLP